MQKSTPAIGPTTPNVKSILELNVNKRKLIILEILLVYETKLEIREMIVMKY